MRPLRPSFSGSLLLLLLVSCATPGAVWRSAPADGSTCYVEEGLELALEHRLAAWLREDLAEVAALLGHPVQDSPAIEIWCGTPRAAGGHLRLGNGESGRHVSLPGHACRIELAVAPSHQLRTYLRHELVHHVLENRGYPEWLNEGLAEYLSYELVEQPSAEDLHQLLHAGLVVSGWGRPLEAVATDGAAHRFAPRIWLPELPEVLRMSYRDYRREVLQQAGNRDPEFHAAGHLLTRVLIDQAGQRAPHRYLELLEAGQDPWEAYRRITRLDDEEATLDAMLASLARAVEATGVAGQRAIREFSRGPCLAGKLPAALRDGERPVVRIEAWPGGAAVPLAPSLVPYSDTARPVPASYGAQPR